MLDKLKKQLGIKESATDVDMAAFEDIKVQFSQLQEQFTAQGTELANLVAQVATFEAEKATLETALSTAIEHAQALEAAAKEVADKQLADKLEARKARLESIVGTEKAAETFEAIKGLDDNVFAAVVTAMATSVEVEANSTLFNETGVSGDAEPATTMTAEEKILRDKFNVK